MHGISQLENRDWTFKQNIQVEGTIAHSKRVQLVEQWNKLVALNASAAYSVNQNFEILGTNASNDDVTFSATFAGLQLQTDGGDDDQVIVLPHLVSGLSNWTGFKWGTENQVCWTAVVRTYSAVTAELIWAGLKLTNTPTIATDNDQVFFRYSTDDSDTTWHVISSIGGTDTNTTTTVSVAASTTYRFKICIDSDRKATCYINDEPVYTTAALTNDVDLIPYIGIQALGAAAKTIEIGPTTISRIFFE